MSVVAERTGRSPDEVAATLLDGPVSSPEDLVRLSRALDDLHSEVLHVQPTA